MQRSASRVRPTQGIAAAPCALAALCSLLVVVHAARGSFASADAFHECDGNLIANVSPVTFTG